MPQNNRKPVELQHNPRDSKGCRINVLKSLYRKSDKTLSFKQFVREIESVDETPELAAAAERWLFNKRANPSKPPLGIGRTNGKKKVNTGGSKKEKKPSKREKN